MFHSLTFPADLRSNSFSHYLILFTTENHTINFCHSEALMFSSAEESPAKCRQSEQPKTVCGMFCEI